MRIIKAPGRNTGQQKRDNGQSYKKQLGKLGGKAMGRDAKPTGFLSKRTKP